MPNVSSRDRAQAWRRPARGRLRQLRKDAEAHAMAKSVASVCRVALYDLVADRRGLAVVCEARQLAMYLVHVVLSRPQDAVGEMFGRKRTTVLHACRMVEDRRDDPRFEQVIDEIESRFAAASAGGDLADAA